jgi:hypothetical protein
LLPSTTGWDAEPGGQSDAVDATVVCLAADGDDILTSDPGDLHVLAQAAEIHVELVPV